MQQTADSNPKKGFKKRASQQTFGPSYFDRALVNTYLSNFRNLHFQDPSKEKKKKKVKTKKNRGDVVNREFEKYSSGSESNEDGDEYESPPPAPEDLYDINPFKSDHEFSCESDVPDTEVQIVKHARTATKGGKQKRGRPPKISKMEEESEEGKLLNTLFHLFGYYEGTFELYCYITTLNIFVIISGFWFKLHCTQVQVAQI